MLGLVHCPWQDMYQLFNYGESDLRFSTTACMHEHGCSFSHCPQLLFLGSSYSFTSVIILTRYTMWSVTLSAADGVGEARGARSAKTMAMHSLLGNLGGLFCHDLGLFFLYILCCPQAVRLIYLDKLILLSGNPLRKLGIEIDWNSTWLSVQWFFSITYDKFT